MSPLTPQSQGFAPSPGQTKGVFPVAPPAAQDSMGEGTDGPLGQFVTTAYGPPWNAMNGTGVTSDGTDLRPNKKYYGVAVDPKEIPLGTYLHIWPNPFEHKGTFKAFDTGGAIKGKRIDFYDWRGRQSQMKWGRKTAAVKKASQPNSQMEPPATGGGISIPNPLNAVDDMAGAVKGFVHFLLSPKSLGDLLAKVVALFFKYIFRAIWQYVIAPVFHWHQRAVLIYYKETLTEKSGIPGFVTLSFWATGYAILWAKLDKDRAMVTDPGHTALGSLVRSFGNTRARRSLVKPKDVQKKTPQKPEPVRSRARINRVGTMTANRRRTVRIGGMENESGLSQRTDSSVGSNGTGDGTETASAAGTDAS